MNIISPAITDIAWNVTEADLDTAIAYGPNRERRKSLRYLTARDAVEIADQVSGAAYAVWVRHADILEDYENLEAALRAGAYLSKDEFLNAHPEIAAAAPAWATQIDVDTPQSDGSRPIGYARLCGTVEIASSATWENGIVTPDDEGRAYVFFEGREHLATPQQLRDFASDFEAAANAMVAGR